MTPRPPHRWTSTEIAQHVRSPASHIPCDPYEQDWENGTLRRIHDPEGRLPPGSGFGLAILLSVALWAIVGAVIFATRVL